MNLVLIIKELKKRKVIGTMIMMVIMMIVIMMTMIMSAVRLILRCAL